MAKAQPELFRKNKGPQRDQKYRVHVDKKTIFQRTVQSIFFQKLMQDVISSITK